MPESEATTEALEDKSYRLTIAYVTSEYGPPHTVTVRASMTDWADLEMTSVHGEHQTTWTADLTSDEDQGPVTVEFKLVLDGRYWMQGWNQTATTSRPPTILDYDDGMVTWEHYQRPGNVDQESEQSFPASDPPANY
jgi:hypothetical protein